MVASSWSRWGSFISRRRSRSEFTVLSSPLGRVATKQFYMCYDDVVIRDGEKLRLEEVRSNVPHEFYVSLSREVVINNFSPRLLNVCEVAFLVLLKNISNSARP